MQLQAYILNGTSRVLPTNSSLSNKSTPINKSIFLTAAPHLNTVASNMDNTV